MLDFDRPGRFKAAIKAARSGLSRGLDQPLLDATPPFVKALSIGDLDENMLIAYEMNGEPLPFLNGFPLRLVVPGHYGTYWIKHLSEISVLTEPFTGFWNATAYRIPDNGCGYIEPGTLRNLPEWVRLKSAQPVLGDGQDGRVDRVGNRGRHGTYRHSGRVF